MDRVMRSLAVVALIIGAAVVGTVGPSAQVPVITGITTQLTAFVGIQTDPSISGSIVVWTDNRNGNDDVRYRHISGSEVQVTNEAGAQRLHDVSGNIIVYTDQSSPPERIVHFDVATNTVLGDVNTPPSARNPRIDGALVAYEVGPTGATDVWFTDLITGAMTQIAATPEVETNPVVSGTRVVFERRADTSAPGDIIQYDITAGVETIITPQPGDARRPDIDGNFVVYDGITASGDRDIFLYDLASGTTTQLGRPVDQRNPHVSGDVVSFDDELSPSNIDVVLYHIPTGAVHVVASSPVSDFLNDISGNRIVYASNVSGNLDIWMYTFDIQLPEIEVTPLEHDFGEVTVGASGTQTVTLANTGSQPLTVSGIEIDTGGSPAFAVIDAPTLPVDLAPGASVDVGVRFSPSVMGPATATLTILSDDADEGVVEVALSGSGLVAPTPSEAMQDLLEFFEASVASGTIVGTGSWRIAPVRVAVVRGFLETAAFLIGNGQSHYACIALRLALELTDGEPVDFLTGPAAPELAFRIGALRDVMGCS